MVTQVFLIGFYYLSHWHFRHVEIKCQILWGRGRPKSKINVRALGCLCSARFPSYYFILFRIFVLSICLGVTIFSLVLVIGARALSLDYTYIHFQIRKVLDFNPIQLVRLTEHDFDVDKYFICLISNV